MSVEHRPAPCIPADEQAATLWLGPIYWFSDWPVDGLPDAGSLVYTIWDRSGVFIYAGLAGRSLTQSKGPISRLAQHARGKRSGDQFLIYVCDRLVLPKFGNQLADIADGKLSLDQETRAYVADNLGFRWIAVDSPAAARALETALKAGAHPPGRPLLNPLRA
jgi:hypothetical protein